jgi:glycosyltransferase involved in cell wall biosynthesis
MSVCEAMASGKPVVGYCGGAVHEVLGDGGFTIPTGDRAELTAAVRELFNRSDYRDELGQLGRRWVAQMYNPADSGRRLADVYSKVIATKCKHA